jgi:hypothetical protein
MDKMGFEVGYQRQEVSFRLLSKEVCKSWTDGGKTDGWFDNGSSGGSRNCL